MQDVSDSVARQSRLIEIHQPDARGLSDSWREFIPDFMQQVQDFATAHVAGTLDEIERIWSEEAGGNSRRNEVLQTVRQLRAEAENIRFPALT